MLDHRTALLGSDTVHINEFDSSAFPAKIKNVVINGTMDSDCNYGF